jgi:hypothetical protein
VAFAVAIADVDMDGFAFELGCSRGPMSAACGKTIRVTYINKQDKDCFDSGLIGSN